MANERGVLTSAGLAILWKLGAAIAAAFAAGGTFWALNTRVADAQVTNEAKHASYEKRLDVLEHETSDLSGNIQVLRDRSDKNQIWQEHVDTKLDKLLIMRSKRGKATDE